MQKISATILEFAEPVLEELPEDTTREDYEMVLSLIVNAWNAVVIDEWNNDDVMKEQFLEALSPIESEFSGLPQKLFERKKSLFADDSRLVGFYELVEKKGEWIFRAEARGKSVN